MPSAYYIMVARFLIHLPFHPRTNFDSDLGGRSQLDVDLCENASPSGEPF